MGRESGSGEIFGCLERGELRESLTPHRTRWKSSGVKRPSRSSVCSASATRTGVCETVVGLRGVGLDAEEARQIAAAGGWRSS